MAAYHNLDLNIEKLIKDGFIIQDSEFYVLAKL